MSNQYSTIPKLDNYTVVFQEKDIIINNSIAYVDTDLIFPLTNGKTYFIETRTWILSNALADLSSRLTDIPTYTFGHQGDKMNRINSTMESDQNESTQTGVWEVFELYVCVIVTQSKTMKLQVSQKQAHASDTIFAAGSFSIIWEI